MLNSRTKMLARSALVPACVLMASAACGGSAANPAAAETAAHETRQETRQPTRIGAASNFSQGWNQRVYESALELPVEHFRDGISWRLVETRRGQYRFDRNRTSYPQRLARGGGDVVLTVNWGNRLYDQGRTPHSPEAVAAFGRFAAEMVQQYPTISAVEVGNEFNGKNFVNGPVRQAGLAQRARYHLAMVRSVAEQVRQVRPEVRILGGATHSVAAGYLWDVLDEAEAGLLDGLAIHPYTTPIDQLAAQIGVLRQHPAARTIPIEVTEWGTKDEEGAADHLLRGYSALAALGVTGFYWYPLNQRGDDYIPLIANNGETTSAGRAFLQVQDRLAVRVAHDVSPDAFTKAYRFGEDTIVIWGESRPVTLRGAGLAVRNAQGRQVEGTLALSPERALVITADRPIMLGEDIVLGCSNLVADSFYQFSYSANSGGEAPNMVSANSGALRFESFALTRGNRQDWQVQPGQQQAGVPWVPYLTTPGRPDIRLTERRIWQRSASGAGDQIVHEYAPPAGGNFELDAVFTPRGRMPGEVSVSVRTGEDLLFSNSERGPVQTRLPIALEPGEILQIVSQISGNNSAKAMNYRLRLHDLDKCAE